MATISFDSFGGVMPRLDPTALADGMATVARDCRLTSTKLNPVRVPKAITEYPIHVEGGLRDLADANTVFLWTRGRNVREFLAWRGDVHVAHSNINDDTRYRIFVTGDTGIGDKDHPNQPVAFISSEDGSVYDRQPLYMEPPPQVNIRLVKNAAELDRDNLRYAFFFQTYVDEYGYESAASPTDTNPDSPGYAEIEYNDGDAMSWGGTRADENPLPDGVVARRLYKTVAGSETGMIKFVAEQPLPDADTQFSSTTVTVKDEDTGETMPTITGIPRDLDWMTALPGNFYAGFLKSDTRVICFSDVNMPTSWPDAYRYAVRDEAVGLAVSGNTVFVLTKGCPWAITGTDPEGMNASKLVSEQPCVSPRSICTFEGAVYYASPDGICVLSESSAAATVVTQNFWSKHDWQELNPSSCVLVGYDAALFAFFTKRDGTPVCYAIDMAGGTVTITEQSVATQEETAALSPRERYQIKAAFVDAENSNLNNHQTTTIL